MVVTASQVLVAGKTAVITGASSGIGKAAALACAEKGMHVWMLDVDEPELATAKSQVEAARADAQNQRIEARRTDVSEPGDLAAVADEVFGAGGSCHFLMNNAAVQLGGGPLSTPLGTWHTTMGVNTFGPMHGCMAFVPRMLEKGEPGIVVNTGSKQGITCPPGNLTYNMSKAALKCYTEGLEHELRGADPSAAKVRAALLVPGWVNTSIMLKQRRAEAASAGKDFDPSSVFFHEDKPAGGAWMPRQVIDFMVEELDQGKFYILCPDNDVDRATDNLRMTWAMQDLTQDRPPLSRWHPDYKEPFAAFLAEHKK